jgi:predicted N-acyltransferase
VAELEVLEGVSSVAPEAWTALVGDASPFLEWEWLASLEQSGCAVPETGWSARPLVAREGGRLVAAAPLYVKAHSEGEFVFDWGWAEAAERAGIAYYPKLLVGVPFTPVGGARFLVAPGEDRARRVRELGGALIELCRQSGFSGAHVCFCREEEIEPLRAAGYDLRLGVQYHWRNEGYSDFEDYLARFRSKRRNQIRRERRAVREAGVRVEILRGAEIGEALLDPMYRFYRETVRARAWGRQYLNRELFALAAERFRERLCFAVAFQGERPIAGTFNVQKGDALYGRYWGAAEPLRNLHFEVCYYAAIEHCIRSGLSRFEPGAGGDYKQLRGFDAARTYSLHYLAEPRLRAAVQRFLQGERAQIERAQGWLLERSALKAPGG